MRRIMLSMLAVAVALGSWTTCPAQVAPAGEMKTLATVAFSGYGEVRADLDFIGKIVENAELGSGLEDILLMMTKDKGLQGLDKTKPWGLLVQTDGQQFPIYGFVPVTDVKTLLSVFEDIEVEDEGGLLKLSLEAAPAPAFVKEANGWAFIAANAEDLANVPDDPTIALNGLHERYDLAVKASIKSVPPIFRQSVVGQLRLGAEAGLQRMPDEGEDEYAIRTGMTRRAIDQMVTMVEELDELLLGFAIDRDNGSVYVDVDVTAIEGTKLAEQFATVKPGPTDFAGFDLPGAAITGNWVGTLSDVEVAQAKSSIGTVRQTALESLKEEGLSEAELELATGLLNDVLDVVEQTLDAKKVDGGVVVMLEPAGTAVVVGGTIADGGKLEAVVKRLVGIITQDSPELADAIKLDAQTHEGIRFHVFTMPVPEEDAKKLLGESIEVVLGVGTDSVYLAAGGNASSLLKQVIDKSKAEPGKVVPPLRIAVALTPIAVTAAQAVPTDVPGTAELLQKLAQDCQQTGGKDHISILSEGIPNGTRTRVEIEEGFLKVLISNGPLLMQTFQSLSEVMGGGKEDPFGDALQ